VRERERALVLIELGITPQTKRFTGQKTDGIMQYRLGGEKRESSGLHSDFRRFSQR